MRRLDPHRTWLFYVGVVALAQTTGWTLAAVYFVQEVGMGPLELVLAGTALEVAYFLFEVPTGIVADLYSRRASVIISQLVMGVGFVLTGAFAEVGVVLAASALIGFGWTFRSGAEDAWLADEVGPERMACSFQRGAQVERAASLAGIALAVALGVVDLSLPLVAAGVLLLGLAVVLASSCRRPASGRPPGTSSGPCARSRARQARAAGSSERAPCSA
jgi:MFS transporter, DHA3 family, tetracycline resistance protein